MMQGLEEVRRVVGNAHPLTAIRLESLARAYYKQPSDNASAETLYAEYMQVMGRVYGENSPEVADARKEMLDAQEAADRRIAEEEEKRRVIMEELTELAEKITLRTTSVEQSDDDKSGDNELGGEVIVLGEEMGSASRDIDGDLGAVDARDSDVLRVGGGKAANSDEDVFDEYLRLKYMGVAVGTDERVDTGTNLDGLNDGQGEEVSILRGDSSEEGDSHSVDSSVIADSRRVGDRQDEERDAERFAGGEREIEGHSSKVVIGDLVVDESQTSRTEQHSEKWEEGLAAEEGGADALKRAQVESDQGSKARRLVLKGKWESLRSEKSSTKRSGKCSLL
ncbi:hypothetical protein HDV00_012762 [Rhizophlyctis rosea]|nr:hypothetical protein HDV00_012762 [Rhizophlyctis rosea]